MLAEGEHHGGGKGEGEVVYIVYYMKTEMNK